MEAELYIDPRIVFVQLMVDSAKQLFQPSLVQPSYTSLSTLDINDSFSSKGYTARNSESGGHWRNGSDSQTTLIGLQDEKTYRSGSNLFEDGIGTVKSIKSRLPTGWRFGAWLATFQACFVLLANIIILIWSATKSGGSAIGVVFQGDCDKVDQYSIVIHLVINILSTVLLGASNYIMQTLCAPTRDEVDSAHEKGIWLDIGLQSIRNLRYTSRVKRRLWIALSISSIPLHLFYNSSFFSTITASEYDVFTAAGPDLQTMTPNSDGRYNWMCEQSGCPGGTPATELFQWDVLYPTECLQDYATDFVSARANVILVAGSYVSNGTLMSGQPGLYAVGVSAGQEFDDPYSWICSGDEGYQGPDTFPLCTSEWKNIDPSNWTTTLFNWPQFSKVNYCLSQPVIQRCQLNFNLPLLMMVIFFNIVKVICMAFSAVKIKDSALVTIGDAIASFTSEPDIHTRDMSLASSDVFDGREISERLCLEYQPRKIRWLNAASRRHWITTILLFAGAISIILGLLIYTVNTLSTFQGVTSLSSLIQLGLGQSHSQNIISWSLSVRQ
ncbi:hypothetical protein D9757_014882 [Collybiopsis confluens]|uniref:DUF6536 domain-containing protein n=1 Tax=Collybiopsis confluens TaxID=2823264 RepID=A0A8H5FP97_9AGAR|nr:hypothetical protein D9757_014882 [Collybiopsis confluens]